jgi:quercetin dioxygenase-like cupin family protein
MAKTQHQLPWKQKEYIQQVKNLLLQCNFPEFENAKKLMDTYENKHPNRYEAASLHEEIDFEVSLFQFEKGEYISHHDHPEMTAVINVISGNALLKNYTIEEQLTIPF